MQCGFGPRAITIAALYFELVLELGIALENLACLGFGDQMFEVPRFVFNALKVSRSAQAFFENGRAFVEVGYLVQRADLELRFPCDGTAIRFREPSDHFEKRGFAGAVGSDQTDFFGGIDLEADVSNNVL